MGTEKVLEKALGDMENGKYEDALTNLNRYLKDNPSDPDARCARGMCYLELGNVRRGKRDIIDAVNMGSKVAEEYIKTNNIEKNSSDIQRNKKIEGLLWFYCVSAPVFGIRCIIYYFFNGGILGFLFGMWCLTSIALIYKRSKYCILNTKFMLLAMLLLSFYLISVGSNRSMEWFLFSVFWLIYFFISKRVKKTLGNVQYAYIDFERSNMNNVYPKIYRDSYNCPSFFHTIKDKTVRFVESVNIKVILVTVSVGVLVASFVMIKKSFDIQSAEKDRYEYVTIGSSIYKIDKTTGERWKLSTAPGRPDVKIK